MVIAENARSATFRWQFNGNVVPGATSDTLLLTNVTAAKEGLYSVVIVNAAGSVTSAQAALWLDSDGDGMGDSWEQAHFGGLNQSALGDVDGDGVTNAQEFLDETDPTQKPSLLARLSILTDGGMVQVSPSKPAYTNGEIVTLTATAIEPEVFHGWTGSTISRTNPLALVMDGDKTLVAHFQARLIRWVGPANGSWHNPTNWSPTLVPTRIDDVVVTTPNPITLNELVECLNLSFAGGSLTGPGALIILNEATWTSGTISGSGPLVVNAGAVLRVNNASSLALENRTLENRGKVIWEAGQLTVFGSRITNAPGALFEARSAASLKNARVAPPRFDNAGTFRKPLPGTTTIDEEFAFNNYGRVEVEAGTLSLSGGGSNRGTILVSENATLEFSGGTHQVQSGSSITGLGHLNATRGFVTVSGKVEVAGTNSFANTDVQVNGDYSSLNNALRIHSGNVNFNGTGVLEPAYFTLSGGNLGGAQTITVKTGMQWTGGLMGDSGKTTIEPGANLAIQSVFPVFLRSRTLENAGNVIWSGNGNIAMEGGVITNRPGALWQILNNSSIHFNAGATPRFDNAGIVRKTSTGTTTFSNFLPFNNYGTLDLRKGTLVATGNFNSSSGSSLLFTLTGKAAQSGYGVLQKNGELVLGGKLEVVLSPAYTPAVNDSFTLATAGVRSGSFSQFLQPDGVSMLLTLTPNSVVVTASQISPPVPRILSPEVHGSDLVLTWTAVANTTYRVLYSSLEQGSEWTAVSGDSIASGTTATKTIPLANGNRFYRVVVVP